jgi:hypothetical protein
MSPKQMDAFADGVAEGWPVRPAAVRAGYSPKSNCIYAWMKRPEFIARVEKHRARREPAAGPNLGPIIERLLAVADRAALAQSDPAMLRAVRELLAEAARLKQLLSVADAAEGPGYELTREAWLANFAPKTPT